MDLVVVLDQEIKFIPQQKKTTEDSQKLPEVKVKFRPMTYLKILNYLIYLNQLKQNTEKLFKCKRIMTFFYKNK